MTTPDDHEINAETIADDVLEIDCLGLIDNAIVVPNDGNLYSLIAAPITGMTTGFVQLGSAGCTINGQVAYTLVMRYKSVLLPSNDIVDVYASDVLKNGQRLLFYKTGRNSAVFIGQVPHNFDLSCKSLTQSSSAQVALASS